jgi:hypothetical protein
MRHTLSLCDYTYLVVAPAEHDIVQPAVGLVHAILGRVGRVRVVWVLGERAGVDDRVGKGTSDYKRVLH